MTPRVGASTLRTRPCLHSPLACVRKTHINSLHRGHASLVSAINTHRGDDRPSSLLSHECECVLISCAVGPGLVRLSPPFLLTLTINTRGKRQRHPIFQQKSIILIILCFLLAYATHKLTDTFLPPMLFLLLLLSSRFLLGSTIQFLSSLNGTN